ncbi:hypothetical protein R50073_47030 [Maricurvus nonylphenolicus]|uniref:fatty acid desaturase family protein n=1 Tax=Maricurvus nonylphenolicus TaxID=1008307 RepID=UPI0036F22D44
MDSVNLDHQAVKLATKYMGDFSWPGVLLGGVCLGGYLAAPFAVVTGVLPLWLGVLLIGMITYAAYTVMHDAVHGAIVGKHRSMLWLQKLLGHGMGFVLGFPFVAHRFEHLAHHRFTNDAERDPDFQIAEMGQSPFKAVRSACRLLSGQYSFYIEQQWRRASTSEKFAVVVEALVAWGARAAFVAQGYWIEGFALFVVGALLGLIALIYLFAYIVHRPHDQVGRYVDTSTIVLDGPGNTVMTWCWLFQNYHSIHHLFPKVPFYKYRALYEEIEPIMRAKGAPIYSLSLTGLKPQVSMES